MAKSFRLLIPFLLAWTTVQAGDLAFSDPAQAVAPPPWAVGQANRAANFDAWPGFQKPPAGFGIVPFFWWLGDPLTKERLGWELGRMAGMGVAGYQINYAHSDQGGRIYGLSFPSDPPLFSDPWWELAGWLMQEAKKQGAGISLSDYTLGVGQGWFVDDILREHPEVKGIQLKMDAEGKVSPENVPWSINPLHPMSGKWYADKFFGQFERHFPGEGGRGLNFFFSDELNFGVSGRLWSGQFAEEFRKRKGYDITPELPALFKDIGPRTPKVRMDYNDVMVSLSEENFFKPVFDWHQQRGMIMGCDHGGRGRDVMEFGDYFRTQRWNQGPGADQPRLSKDLIKAKVAASIAHLYQRPRVWLEGYHSSGWGTSSADIVDATFGNFVMGYNLLSFHGMYYSTHGGWWEWAPPDNTFRMPYWQHLRGFMDCVQRISFLLTQGHHRCDVAILYPVAPAEAGMDGAKAVETAFRAAEQLYAKGVDFDFIDFESLARAEVAGNELRVSGEAYRELILPAMKAVRHSTLEKALEFHRAGGVILALGALPTASERVGRDDPQIEAMVKELFPNGVAKDVFDRLPARDYDGPGWVQHRRIGQRDLYAVYKAQNAEVSFRASGSVELWDPWTGAARPLPVISQSPGTTRLRLPLTEKDLHIIVFSPGHAEIAAPAPEKPADIIHLEGQWDFELQPTSDNRFGDFHWPPTPALIGAEVRQLWYCEGDHTNGPWRKVTCSFGPQFLQSTALPPAPGAKPYEFSWRWGIENDPGHQGYHGLKEQMHDEFLAIGKPVNQGDYSPTVLRYEAQAPASYFSTAIVAPRDLTANALVGELQPSRVWLNGELITNTVLRLKTGPNPLVLEYNKPGRAYFVASTQLEIPPLKVRPSPLATRWWNHPAVLPFDTRADEKQPVGWYRFTSPPGWRAMTVQARGKLQAWADGQPMAAAADGRLSLQQPASKPVTVLMRIEQEHGCYAGAAFANEIQLECSSGLIELGDWSKNDSLLSYSGGAWYRKDVTLPEAHGRKIMLNLGEVVASAEVRINGQPAGTKVAPPWTLDITPLVKAGSNRIEVLVCNTLANHYTSVPTHYRGAIKSGLLGPVVIELR